MDRGRREEDRNRDYHEDRGRQDTRERRPDRGQREYRDRRGDDGWACGPRSGTGDGRGGAPRPSGGRQFETRYDSQALQHQPRSEAMAVHNSGARRGESEQQYDEPSLRRDEPQRRYDEPSHRRDGPQRQYEEPWEWRHRDEPQWRNDESGSCGSGLVSTASECDAAATALDLSDKTAYDYTRYTSSYPPGCQLSYGDLLVYGGGSTGSCSSSKKCTCTFTPAEEVGKV